MSIENHMLKILDERGSSVRFIRAIEQNMPCWFYLKINPVKLPEYERKMKEGAMNISDYGQILDSDWGVHPPADVASYMREKYGIDIHDAK